MKITQSIGSIFLYGFYLVAVAAYQSSPGSAYNLFYMDRPKYSMEMLTLFINTFRESHPLSENTITNPIRIGSSKSDGHSSSTLEGLESMKGHQKISDESISCKAESRSLISLVSGFAVLSIVVKKRVAVRAPSTELGSLKSLR